MAADATVVNAAFDAIAANRPAGEVLAMLREVEPRVGPDRRGRFLVARAIAANRLGLPGEALGDLHEALLVAAEHEQQAVAAEAWSAIARVYAWRGGGRDAALALFQALAAEGDGALLPHVLLDAGRIEHEIGRPARAVPLQRRALAVPTIDATRRRRGLVELAQSAVAAEDVATAIEALTGFSMLPDEPAARLRLLACLVRSRIALIDHDIVAARAHLDEAVALAPLEPDAFEHVECRQVAAEIALASGDVAQAAAQLHDVVARMASDDLAGPEIESRLLQAAALDAAGEGQAADRTLAAALRRAQAGDLGFYADRVRQRFIMRGRPPPDYAGVAAGGLEMPTGRPGSSRFVRRRLLGAGGAASVWRAYDIETGREVTLKKLKLPGYDPASRDAWLGEARREAFSAGLIRHPGVARVLGIAVEDDDAVMLVRELIEGRDLRSVMVEATPLHSPLLVLADLAWALAAIHAAGIAHGDIKPENVIVRQNGRPTIIDLGSSRTSLQAEGVTPLSTAYASPERLRGGVASTQDDLHAFAVMSHEVLTGSRPPAAAHGWAALIARKSVLNTIGATLTNAGLRPDLVRLLGSALLPPPWGRRPEAAALALALETSARR